MTWPKAKYGNGILTEKWIDMDLAARVHVYA